MLAYYIEIHMRTALAPILFHDEEDAPRDSVVASAGRSATARAKDAGRRTEDGWPVVSFRDGIGTLNGIVRGRVDIAGKPEMSFQTTSRPGAFQAHIIDLMGLKKRM